MQDKTNIRTLPENIVIVWVTPGQVFYMWKTCRSVFVLWNLMDASLIDNYTTSLFFMYSLGRSLLTFLWQLVIQFSISHVLGARLSLIFGIGKFQIRITRLHVVYLYRLTHRSPVHWNFMLYLPWHPIMDAWFVWW